jgi:hypothetical protein
VASLHPSELLAAEAGAYGQVDQSAFSVASHGLEHPQRLVGMKLSLGGSGLSGAGRTVALPGLGAFWENVVGWAVLDDGLRARACFGGRRCDLPGCA